MIEGWLEHSSIGEDLQCYLMLSGKVQKIHGTPNCSLKMGLKLHALSEFYILFPGYGQTPANLDQASHLGLSITWIFSHISH
jgi:hypothetical protein